MRCERPIPVPKFDEDSRILRSGSDEDDNWPSEHQIDPDVNWRKYDEDDFSDAQYGLRVAGNNYSCFCFSVSLI